MKTKIITFSDLLESLAKSAYKMQIAYELDGVFYIDRLKQSEITIAPNEWIGRIKWIIVYTGTQQIVLRNRSAKTFLKTLEKINKRHLSKKREKVKLTPQQQRKKIVALYKQGFAGTYIAKKLSLTVVTVSKWITKYKELEKFCNDREAEMTKQIDRVLTSNTATAKEISDLMKGLDLLKKYHNTLKTRF